MLRAGTLKDRIQVLVNQPTKSPSGQPVDNWQPFGSPAWADVQQIGGREQLRAGRELNPGEYSIRLRYRAGLTAAHRIRILATGVVLDIGVPQVDRHAGWITLTASEVPA